MTQFIMSNRLYRKVYADNDPLRLKNEDVCDSCAVEDEHNSTEEEEEEARQSDNLFALVGPPFLL